MSPKDVRLGAEVSASLYSAIVEAGGMPPPRILEMTVLELLTLIAPNNIRFVYTAPANGDKP